MSVRIGDKFRTRSGRAATITQHTSKHPTQWPIKGTVYGMQKSWTVDGFVWSDDPRDEDRNDLIGFPNEPIKRK